MFILACFGGIGLGGEVSPEEWVDIDKFRLWDVRVSKELDDFSGVVMGSGFVAIGEVVLVTVKPLMFRDSILRSLIGLGKMAFHQ